MSRRTVAFLALSLILGTVQECVSAEPGRPETAVGKGSVELAWNKRQPTLERSDREFFPDAGKRVRRIQIRDLNVFGPSVEDTTRVPKTRLGRLLNHLNFRTRETTIRQTLLFREGDAIDPFRLADSERILRNLAFVGDARIVVEPIPGSDDSADVRVFVKESWTLQLSESLKPGNRLSVSLIEQNLLGLGHRIAVAATRTPDATPRLGLDASYSVQNVRGSFVTGKADYVKVPGQETAGLSLFRTLISPVLRYAGGLDLRRTSIVVPDSLPSAADNTSELVDLWAGRPVHQWHDRKDTGRRRMLFVSGRVRHLRFTRRPPVTASTFYEYHDMEHVLGSLSYARSRYYRTNLLYSFGRTEDIPYGFLARVTYGLAHEEFAQTHYAAATLAAGEKIYGLGYGVGEVRMGGSPRHGVIERGVIRIRTIYFSNLMHAGRFRFRQFARAAYTAGIHRFADDSIDFNGDESIRGVVYDRRVAGSKRLQLGLESVTFTPWTARGVTFAFFTFADLDVVGVGHRNVLAQDYYSGFGLGLRLHKKGFGIGPVQLRFVWYPRLPVDHAAFSYTGFAEKRIQPIEFLGIAPEIVEY